MSETIYALATPPGKSGVAVVRVSGPDAWDSLTAMAPDLKVKPRYAHYTRLADPLDGGLIDQALVLAFKAPASFTGEDVVEYHIHGGRAVRDSLLQCLARQAGHRLAEPGEFTRRAFEQGKIDLTEAEAIADLIDAQTQIQKNQALHQMEGKLARLYLNWADRLTPILAHLEADIEFPDEDMPEGILPELLPKIQEITEEISGHLLDSHRGEKIREGIKVAIIGAPNAGKSSLINQLAKRDVAIVSEQAGTTRDVIQVELDLKGYPLIISDTAGLRPEQLSGQGQDLIESEGIKRAIDVARQADIRVLVFDGTDQTPHTATLDWAEGGPSLIVVNKADQKQEITFPKDYNPLKISALEGQGIENLLEALTELADGMIGRSEAPAITRDRHRQSLTDAKQFLDSVLTADLPELCAEDLRLAVRSLGRITGKVDVEDLLDIIFKDFCIGK